MIYPLLTLSSFGVKILRPNKPVKRLPRAPRKGACKGTEGLRIRLVTTEVLGKGLGVNGWLKFEFLTEVKDFGLVF
ncbi:hypothetical protein REPUB_Repub12eG0058000 [Reevesia pubescens]